MQRGGRFLDKVAIVTGGGSGIGRETARRFAEEGARVVIFDIAEEAARDVAREIGGSAIGLGVDVSSKEAVDDAVASLASDVNGVDILVNNAGIVINGGVFEIEEEDWDRELDTNLKSVYLMSRALWSSLRERRGAIVSIGSMLGIWAKPFEAAYCASKAGMIMLTQCMALEGARLGIRANCVCPGFVDTPITQGYLEAQGDPDGARKALEDGTPLGRLGRPEDIAKAVLFLSGEEAGWITGAVLVVDGGVTTGFWGATALSGGLYEMRRGPLGKGGERTERA